MRAPELFSLQGKEILLTGATGHLGQAMAEAMAQAGGTVLVNSRSPEKCEALVHKLSEQGLSSAPAVFDVTDPTAIGAFFASRSDRPLHALVNNAYHGKAGFLETSGPDSYSSSYEVCVTAAHNLLNAALPALRRGALGTGGASVVNIASMYGMVSPDPRVYTSEQSASPPFYGAAKAALLQLTRYAACEFGPDGIRVNAISPGPFPSQETQDGDPRFIERLTDKVPLGRIGQPEEITGPLVFLVSGASSFVNGANIVVDGGWTCW